MSRFEYLPKRLRPIAPNAERQIDRNLGTGPTDAQMQTRLEKLSDIEQLSKRSSAFTRQYIIGWGSGASLILLIALYLARWLGILDGLNQMVFLALHLVAALPMVGLHIIRLVRFGNAPAISMVEAERLMLQHYLDVRNKHDQVS